MAVAFDAVGPSSSGATTSGTTTLSWTHTPGSSGVALVADAAIGVSPDTGFSATCALDPAGANTNMPSLGLRHVNNGTSGFQQEFGLANVSSGAHTVKVTVSGGTPATIVAGSKSYTGADTVSPFSASQVASGNSGTPSLAFTGSTSGNMVTAGMAIGTAGAITMTAGTQRWSNPFDGTTGAGNSAGGDIAAGGTVTLTWNPGGTDFWAVVGVEVKVPAAAAGGVQSAAPGQTWLRRFHHRQTLPLPPPPAAVAAGVPVFFPPPLRNTRAASRGHLGRMGACAAGILAVTTLAPQPSSVPPERPQPVIQHPAPHRAIWRGILRPPQLPFLTADLPPTAVSPRPQHRATGKGVLAKTTLSAQPAVVNVLPQPVPIRRPGPHRVLWRSVAGPAPAAVVVTAVPPARPQPVTNRPPAPHRATGKGILAPNANAPQPTRVPPPQWRQPNAPRPAHRALWRAIAGPAPAVVVVTAVPPSRPGPTTNRPPAPHRATVRRLLAPPAPLVPPERPQPTVNRPPPPHRAIVRGVLAKTTLSAQPTRVNGPQWRQPFAPRPAHRATWRRIAGAAPPPPPFTIGALTATDKPQATQTPADKPVSALTALTGPSGGTLTATDKRTGGPS